nr:hypothetical protein [Tanacetum cinerariifolium]
MRELREDTFSENKNDDAHEHVERVLDIFSLFNIPRVSHDVVMLRVFPITLTRATKGWVDRLPPGTFVSWDLLKKAFIQRNIEGSSDFEGIAAIVNKLENLGQDMKKLKENVHAIQVGCQIYKRAHIDKDCPLNEDVKSVEEVKYGEFGKAEALAALEATRKIKKEKHEEEKQSVNYYIDPYETPIPFPRRLEHHVEEALVHKTMESLKKIKINSPLLKEIRQTDNYAKYMKDLRDRFRDEEDDLEDPEECEEHKANVIKGVIHDTLNNDWFNNTSEDKDYLEGMLDYLEPISYDGFIDLDDKACNERRCKLLGMTYKEPTLILIKKVKDTRYTIGPGSIYKEVEFEVSSTRSHVEARFCLGVPILVTP